MAGYHKYIFDTENREFVGRFDEMYVAEEREGFDSWHQDDMRSISNQICLLLLNRFNFGHILDVGCGKGTFAHLLKKVNNQVTGIDLSETALNVARTKFPDIEFLRVNLVTEKFTDLPFFKYSYDLTIFMEILSYLPNWREIIKEFARISKYALVSLFIPEHPIGYVKSRSELLETFQEHFQLLNDIHLVTSSKTILFGHNPS